MFAAPSHNYALDHVRPLAIGAAYCEEFECLAPAAWREAIVIAGLFKVCDLERAGWTDVDLTDLGARNGCRRWRVRRG